MKHSILLLFLLACTLACTAALAEKEELTMLKANDQTIVNAALHTQNHKHFLSDYGL